MPSVGWRTRAVAIGSLSWLALSGCGPDELFVDSALALGDDCEVLPDDAHATSSLSFDIAPGAKGGSTACDDPFVVPLWVDNPNDERVRVTDVEVSLETLQRQRLVFDRDEPLANPFLALATGTLPPGGSGVIEIELIPTAYAASLTNFVDDRMVAEILLLGETSSGTEVESRRARLPIEICDGCRTLCESSAEADAAICSDPELGPLRVFCLDPGC